MPVTIELTQNYRPVKLMPPPKHSESTEDLSNKYLDVTAQQITDSCSNIHSTLTKRC